MMFNSEKNDRLTGNQMAQFVNNGFVRLDEVIPLDICQEVKDLFDGDDLKLHEPKDNTLESKYPKENPLYKLIHVPKVKGMITSLVGANPLFDHHAIHRKQPGSINAQVLHQDAEIDIRENAFDIQLSFFIHDVPKEMGGTRFLPGSHLRKVHETQIGRYQHVKGMIQVECKAGTVVAWHHNLWHGAQPNHTDQMRYMFKLRLNPTVTQQLLWNDEKDNEQEMRAIMFAGQPWYGQEERIEMFSRIRMWRHLSKNPKFDHSKWYHRVENIP